MTLMRKVQKKKKKLQQSTSLASPLVDLHVGAPTQVTDFSLHESCR